MRLLRTTGVVVLLAAMHVATAATPAEATTVGATTFQGAAWFSWGLSYPCVGRGTLDMSKCPVFSGSDQTTVAKVIGVPVWLPVDPGGNLAGFAFMSSVCVGTLASTLHMHPVAGGSCAIYAAGYVTGSCGFSSSLGNYNITVDVPLIYQSTVTGTFNVVSLGGTLVLTGDVDGSPGSQVIGALQANAVPVIEDFPRMGNSCLEKTARDFSITGTIALVAV